MPIISLPAFVETVARASVILALTGLVTTALRRSSASSRHLMWMLGLMSALVVPVLALALPKIEVPLVRIAATEVTGVTERTGQTSHEGTEERIRSDGGASSARSASVSPLLRVTNGPVSPSAPSAPSPSSPSASAIALTVWAVGAAIVLARILLGLAAVQWMSRRTRAVSEGAWLELARGLAADLGLSNVRFLQSATASMPMAWGLVRASVLMPADADSWPIHRLRVVLLHELAHVKRRDCLTHVAAQIVCAAYWFNPLAWMAARRLRSERERACDDLVLAAGTRGSDYASELIDIARVMQSQRFPAVLGGASLAMAHRTQLEGRVMAILDPTVPRRGLTLARVAATVMVFTVLMFSVAAVQPWAEGRAAVNAAVADQASTITTTPAPTSGEQTVTRVESTAQVNTHNRVETKVQGKVSGSVATDVAETVSDAIAGVAGGVVGGVVNGVAGGVVSGVADGVVASVVGGIQANPNPNPNPNPQSGRRSNADPRAVAALMDALKDSDKEVRETAMHALVQMRDPRIFDPLVAALKDSSPDVREQAVFGLGQLRDARAVEPLMSVLHDSNPDVREQAVFALGQIRDKRAIDPLISALKDEKPDVRQQAAFALGQIRDAKAVEALVIALKDGNADVRQQAAFALGQLRDPRAIDALTAAMKDANVEVRRQAAFALGQIRY